ncbi:hypothetical protein ACU4GA_26690 [Methylobacterium oryzae CBMB20]
MPVYFLLVSLAAWLALIELVRAPLRWNKTRHGLAPDLPQRPASPSRGPRDSLRHRKGSGRRRMRVGLIWISRGAARRR